MADSEARRLAVLGSPITHSKSPALHRAAYRALDLNWDYDAVEVQSGGLSSFLDGLDERWRGLSLTMPLKREILPRLEGRSALVDEVGAANTVLIEGGELRGFNTDVPGIVAAFGAHGVSELESVQLLGAGATAASVLSAVARMGAVRVLVSARDTEKARSLEPLAETLGIELTIRRLGLMDRSMIVPDAIVSTLPGGTPLDVPYAEPIRQGAVLFDVAYEPWPSALAQSWLEVGGTVVSGLELLLHQAIAQVRIFVTGSEAGALDHEEAVIAAMRAAVGL